ncbi:MAG: FAD-dependent monooxygenase [Labilithrix sp.]|nr:FAD-dependent monooxygenase [Labilithrix sp.]MCW5815340.1 FAD-dependent monooxygenase [Labilithrix sp.]
MSDDFDFDVVVAGGGPAGLAAAIHAAHAGLRVLVVDPHGPASIDKACGEGIMPGGVDALRRLGVRPEGRPFVGIRYALAADPACEAFGNFPIGSGLGVRRTALSGALLDRAAMAGVRFREGRVAGFTQEGDEVTLADGTRARWLIAADGLRSPIRRALKLSAPPRHAPRFGLRRHYAMSPWTMHVEVHLAADAEAYVTPVADDLVGVAILFGGAIGGADPSLEHGAGRGVELPPEHGAGARYDALLRRFPALSARLAGAEAASAVRGAGPFEQRVSRRVAGNVLLVGDAAGYLDPLTGEGVALGLATAEAAVDAIRADDPASYDARYDAITHRYFTLTSALLAVVRRPALHRPLIRAARAWPSMFDRVLGVLAHLRADGETPVGPLLPEAPYV